MPCHHLSNSHYTRAYKTCKTPILNAADFIGSTSALLKFTTSSTAKEFIVATEPGILFEMKEKNPDKVFIPAPPNDSTCACNECNFMKLNTMEKLYNCLQYEVPEVFIADEVQKRAVKPINRMLEISEQLGL